MGEITETKSPDRAASGPAGADAPGAAHVFRREGEYWTIAYVGATVPMRDAIGLRYIAYLLAHQRERFAAANLAAAVKGIGAGDAERARSAVSKRIRSGLRRI